MRFSIVVCSRNRADRLPKVIEALSRIAFTPQLWELVFVNNGSTDETHDVILDLKRVLPCRFHYTEEALPGLARSRNRGILEATGDMLVFTDDDCYATPDLLSAYDEIYSSGTIDYGGGRVLPFRLDTPHLSMQERINAWNLPSMSFLPAGLIHGANMSVKRDVAINAGGFDEQLGAGSLLRSGEDVEFLARLSFLGHVGGYFPQPTVYHDHDRMAPAKIRETFHGYDLGRGAYLFKMICNRTSRRVYIAKWLRSTVRGLKNREIRRILGELFGALRYIRISNSEVQARPLLDCRCSQTRANFNHVSRR